MALLMLEALFLRTIEDLEKRLVDPDPYEVLRIAGYIRKLFLNGFPLVDQVNGSHKIKLLFEVTVPVDRQIGNIIRHSGRYMTVLIRIPHRH